MVSRLFIIKRLHLFLLHSSFNYALSPQPAYHLFSLATVPAPNIFVSSSSHSRPFLLLNILVILLFIVPLISVPDCFRSSCSDSQSFLFQLFLLLCLSIFFYTVPVSFVTASEYVRMLYYN